jgi:hypothetical protein
VQRLFSRSQPIKFYEYGDCIIISPCIGQNIVLLITRSSYAVMRSDHALVTVSYDTVLEFYGDSAGLESHRVAVQFNKRSKADEAQARMSV